MSIEMTNELKMKLRGQGLIPLKEEGFFSVRALMPAGVVPLLVSRKMAEISEKYGRGYYLLTQRLNIEIPFIKYDDLEKVKSEIESVGVMVGGAGKRVRAVHSCKGTVCRFGLYDVENFTRHFMDKIYKEYYDTVLPNKFRIGLSGCPNSCSKPQLTDIGLVGKKLGKVDVYIGGMYGRIYKIQGTLLIEEVTLEQAESYIRKAVDYYQQNGVVGERFPKMIQRIGLEKIKEALLSIQAKKASAYMNIKEVKSALIAEEIPLIELLLSLGRILFNSGATARQTSSTLPPMLVNDTLLFFVKTLSIIFALLIGILLPLTLQKDRTRI